MVTEAIFNSHRLPSGVAVLEGFDSASNIIRIENSTSSYLITNSHTLSLNLNEVMRYYNKISL